MLGERSDAQRRRRQTTDLAVLVGPAGLLTLFLFVTSMLMLFRYSFYHFTGMQIIKSFSVEAYVDFFTDPFFGRILANGFRVGATTSLMLLLVGYPTAYAMARIKKPGLLIATFVLVFSPLLTSVIVRSYGWMLLLNNGGLINYLLRVLRVVQEPVQLLYNFTGVEIALVHVLMPFAVFPMLSVLLQMKPVLKDAAADLGANRLQTFWHVTLPISLPGVLSAFQLSFVLSMSSFASVKMLGGGRVYVLPISIYENIADRNWPLGAVQSIVLLSLVLMVMAVTNWVFRKAYIGPEGRQ
ncbi:MAG: ABC transporter permease [Chloroflexi bacterium]|nr:ABC transporter permease [Chloroflexota bacterium]